MRWQILHRTTYRYASPARDSFNDARLEPAANETQTVESFLLTITPAAELRRYADFYGNCVHHFEVAGPHSSLDIQSQAVVATHPPGPLAEEALLGPLGAPPQFADTNSCFDYLGASRFVDLGSATWRLAVDLTEGIGDTWQAARAIMRGVHGYLAYTPDTTHVHTHVAAKCWRIGGGCARISRMSCLGMCRALRIPARYDQRVSGHRKGQRDARLGGSVAPAGRLACDGPDAQPPNRRHLHQTGRWPRLRRRAAGLRLLQGQPGAQDGS